MRQAEQFSGEHYASLESDAARRAELGIYQPTLRQRLRHVYRWLTRQKPAER
jgi:hypothetical protein